MDKKLDDSIVTFGVAGTSAIGGKVIPAFHAVPNAKVIGVGSRDVQKAQDYCDKHDAGIGMSYEDLLSHPDIDVIYVPFPTAMRNDFIAKVIAAGKHVYGEKPLGGSNAELKKLVDDCAVKGLQWMDGTMWYHSNRTKEIEAKLRAGELGVVRHVNASFSFMAPDNAWLEGGNNRTNKGKEPFGCLGDMGHYPISAIMWAFDYELPQAVQATWTRFNSIDTLVAGSFVLIFSNNRRATFDFGADLPHRSQYEINGERGSIKVNDLVGGFGRTGNFAAYEVPFVGSTHYTVGDVMGKDDSVQVEASDHVKDMVAEITRNVLEIRCGGSPNPEWPMRSLTTHRIMTACFKSATNGGEIVDPSTVP